MDIKIKKINKIECNSKKEGIYKISTKSGSEYILEISEEITTLKRVNANHMLKNDGTPIKVLAFKDIVVGKGAAFLLDPIGMGIFSSKERFTSKVIKILQAN